MKTFALFASALSLLAVTTVLLPACSVSSTGEKAPIEETSQGIVKSRLAIAGSLAYGQTSSITAYANPPRYTAYAFTGNPGDEVDIWVKSEDGDPIVWLLDGDLRIVAMNDDASRFDTNAHVDVALRTKKSMTHYVVVRDYWLSKMSFRVTLGGPRPDPTAGCSVDADCVRIDEGCCSLGEYVAVHEDEVDAYRASLTCPNPLYCPLILAIDDHSMAQCNVETHRCEVVKPKDIACNGFSINPHACPEGWQCRLPGFVADVPGKCVQPCGGFAGLQCTDPDAQCMDDPTDDCDPNAGGADCGGICISKGDDCRVTGCTGGKACAPCMSGSWSCVAEGGDC